MFSKVTASFSKNFLLQLYEKDISWKVLQGSVLDHDFLKQLNKFDYVYSWGVLHHTGNMWKALDNQLYGEASFQMMDSLWARQTPNRAKKLAKKMKGA